MEITTSKQLTARAPPPTMLVGLMEICVVNNEVSPIAIEEGEYEALLTTKSICAVKFCLPISSIKTIVSD